MSIPLRVLYEDNHLLIVSKRAGLPTMGAEGGGPSLWQRAKDYLKHKYHKPGNVYLGIVSRLDAPVSGAIVFARTSKAADRLNRQFREREVEKEYWAIIEGHSDLTEGRFEDWIYKDDRAHRMRCAPHPRPDAQRATLAYRVLRPTRSGCLVSIRLETGRKHQIRVQFAQRGYPIVGDRKYGSRQPFPAGIALHARRLRLAHPVGGRIVEVMAPLPGAWRQEVQFEP